MIEWDQILAECAGYRAGFVAVFRKYEGQATDEKDAQGRTVKVTMASFARHTGIAEQTFRDWVKQSKTTVSVAQPAGKDQTLREQFDDVVAGLVLDLPEEASMNARIEQAIELAKEGVSFRKIGAAVGLDESVVRRNIDVRNAKAENDTGFDVVGSARHFDKTSACDIEPAPALIHDVKMLLRRLTSPVYTLSKIDKNKLRTILNEVLKELSE